MYKLLTSTSDEYKSGLVRGQGEIHSQLKSDHIVAKRSHMYVMIKVKDLFGFLNDFRKEYIWYMI